MRQKSLVKTSNCDNSNIDIGLLVSSILMLGFGVVLVYSSSFAVAERFGDPDYFLVKHLVRVLIGLFSFMIFIKLDYHLLCKLSRLGYLCAILLLVIVLMLPESHAIKGAKRWLSLGFVNFQVSDFARMMLIIYMAARAGEIGEKILEWKNLIVELIKIGVISGLIVAEPSYSNAAVVTLIGILILFVWGARLHHLTFLAAVAIPLAFWGIISVPYRKQRFLSFLNMSNHAESASYQLNQALIGLGNGGLFGVGLGQGAQKFYYLPEPHTDFVFAILGEETGLIGLLLVLCVMGYMIYRGIHISFRAPDLPGRLMAFGFTAVLAAGVVLHAAVNTGLVPTTGVPFPFLSYGGMNLVFTMSSIGILLNISKQARLYVSPKDMSAVSSKKYVFSDKKILGWF